MCARVADRSSSSDTFPPGPCGQPALPHGENGLQGSNILHAPDEGSDANAIGRLHQARQRPHGGHPLR